ncbi:MAG: hypothetical protein ABIP94_25350 [Planctomycetota bacterium]
MTGLSCSRARDLLPLFVGGDLPVGKHVGGGQPSVLRAHLLACSDCRREAAGLQQANKAMRAACAAARPAVLDTMFVDMHASILTAVQAEVARREPGLRSAWRRPWFWAAAAVLFLAGVWLVRDPGGLTLLQRAPIATPVSADGPVLVVPWAGPRVEIEPLGEESWTSGSAESGVGPGMMGRGRLRALVDEGTVPPARADAQRKSGAAPAQREPLREPDPRQLEGKPQRR